MRKGVKTGTDTDRSVAIFREAQNGVHLTLWDEEKALLPNLGQLFWVVEIFEVIK